MKNYLFKIRHIIPAFLLIALGSILAIVSLRYLLAIRFPVLHLRREIWEFGLSLLVPIIAALIWLRHRVRILEYEVNGENKRFYLIVALIAAIGVSGYNAQTYLTTSLGKLQHLHSIYQIDSLPHSCYYDLHDFTIWKQNSRVHVDFRTSGKHDEDFDMTIYIAAPIMGMDDTSMPDTHRYWYAVRYAETIKNSYTDQEKEKYFNQFYEKSIEELNTKDLRKVDHFSLMDESSDRDMYVKAIEEKGFKDKAGYIILSPEHDSYDKRSGNSLAWIFLPLGIAVLLLLLILVWGAVYDYGSQGASDNDDEFIELLTFLIPRGDHFITSIIIDLNLIVFLVMVISGISLISPSAPELLLWGGNRRPEVLHGDWWRLLTNVFVHAGIMHLIVNSVGLAFGGVFIEPFLGRRNYAILYLLSGVAASAASIWWHLDVVSVGASGAIFGVYGAILGLAMLRAFPDDSKTIFIMIAVYVGINLVWGLTGGIDNAAHIGGLIAGFILGILLYKISGPSRPVHEL